MATVYLLVADIEAEDETYEIPQGVFTDLKVAEDVRDAINGYNEKAQLIWNKSTVISQRYRNFHMMRKNSLPKPKAPTRPRGEDTTALQAYLRVQVEKGNIEQAESVRNELKEIVRRNGLGTEGYQEEVAKYHEALQEIERLADEFARAQFHETELPFIDLKVELMDYVKVVPWELDSYVPAIPEINPAIKIGFES